MDDVLALIKQIGKQEEAIKKLLFVSPIFYNKFVATQIFGIIYKFKLASFSSPGWYKIKPVDAKQALIKEAANLEEIESYLKRLHKIRLILVMKKDNVFFGIAEKTNNLRLPVDLLIPVYLTDDSVLEFDRIIARFDGTNFWYHQIDSSNDISKSEYLRKEIIKYEKPEKINYSGLTLEEKIAYAIKYNISIVKAEDFKKESVKNDVEYAGGQFVKFEEKNDHYSVTYIVDRQEYTSYVTKDPKHSVITAGICLSGGDKAFDLKSLVTVMRQGQYENRIHRVGLQNFDGNNEEDEYED